MALNLQIIHPKDFIRTTPDGGLDWEETKGVFTAIATAAQKLTDFVILIDVRKIHASTLTVADTWELAQHLMTWGTVFTHKTALLIAEEAPGDRARFFELCARNRGFQISVFKDFEHAIDWLASSTPEEINTPH